MRISNYHTHCKFCDGVGEPRAFVEQAIAKGFKHLGFSSHAPLPFETVWNMKESSVESYLDTVQKLKQEFKEDIEIYCGMEIDFFESDNGKLFNKYDLDYVIGSVHFFRTAADETCYGIDGGDDDFRRTLNDYFKGDMRAFVKAYYGRIQDMVRLCKPAVLGHFDIIKKSNRDEKFFSEKEGWYREAVQETLLAVKESGTILEINTGAMIRGFLSVPYPSDWILHECKRLDIPITINSDTHAPENLDGYFDLAFSMAREAGYTEQVILKNGIWQKVNIL